MKLGFSLAPQIILGSAEQTRSAELLARFGSTQQLLRELKSQGISSIEIRYMPRQMDPALSERILHTVWEAGLEVSIHGQVDGDYKGPSFADIYPPMRETLQHYDLYQKRIAMPIHAYAAKEGSRKELSVKTAGLFSEWIRMVEAEALPMIFGIELNRRKSGTVDPGDTCEGVVEMVEAINNPHAGITWDMGHYYSNVMNEGIQDSEGIPTMRPWDRLPPAAFLERTVHTHIHGLGERGTHCPLTEPESLPLEAYVQALKRSAYQGIYNLELDFSRFPEQEDAAQHIIASIQRLRECVAASPPSNAISG
jgi:sugar phosphate isomerase/epimerase